MTLKLSTQGMQLRMPMYLGPTWKMFINRSTPERSDSFVNLTAKMKALPLSL